MTKKNIPHQTTYQKLPDHNDLPCSDETFVENFLELPQSILLTTSIEAILEQIHPDGRYIIGQDCGIYWRIVDPPVRGAICPDWFYVGNVNPTINGQIRRSYVLWNEPIRPLIAIQFVCEDGSEERDNTPLGNSSNRQRENISPGKFWVYENVIQPNYYVLYEVFKSSVEVYQLVNNRFVLMTPNLRNHFPIAELGVELGIWIGQYQNFNFDWLRWWDSSGNLLLTASERVNFQKQCAEQERQRAEMLAQKLRELGIEVEP